MTRVLHVNHTSVVGGAERSLLALLDHTDPARIAGICCPPGPLAVEIKARTLPWYRTEEPEARFNASVGERLAAAARLARTGPAVERIARRTGADVVHANSIRTALGVTLSSQRLVTHVRDVLPLGSTASMVKRVVVGRSARVVAISEFVATRFSEDANRPRRRIVVDNPIDLRRFPLTDRRARDLARRDLGLPHGQPLVLTIGQITAWKQQLLAIEAVAAARERGLKVHLAVVGSVKFTQGRTGISNRAYEATLHRRVAELGLRDSVTFVGEQEDIPAFLAAADAVLIPSVDEPFGRVAAEAIASGVPVVTSAVGGPADVVSRYGGGIVIANDDADEWAAGLASLLSSDVGGDPEHHNAAAARVRDAFDARRHAAQMATIFDGVGR